MIDYFKGETERFLGTARSLTDGADHEGRQLTDAERTEVQEALGKAQEFKSKVQDELDKKSLRESIERLGTVELGKAEVVDMPVRTMGDGFIKSEAYKAIKARGTQGQWSSGSVELPFKAAGGPVLESGGTNDNGFQPTFLNTLADPGLRQFPLTVADLLAVVTVTSGNSVSYPTVVTRTPMVGSGFVAEGAAKLGVDFAFDVETKTLLKIANYIKVSEEMIEDAPAIAQYINNQLPMMIRQAEEAYLALTLYADADGASTGSNVSGTNGFDAILEAQMVIREAGFEPDGILITPLDWATLAATKDGVNGGYFSGGPYAGPASNPWGLRAVITPSATPGSPLVGAFKAGATIYRKGGVSLEATNSNADDFIKNLVAIRAEERMVMGTTYPEAFCTADIT